jgi:hypothetical protein
MLCFGEIFCFHPHGRKRTSKTVIWFSESLLSVYHTTWHYIPKDCNLPTSLNLSVPSTLFCSTIRLGYTLLCSQLNMLHKVVQVRTSIQWVPGSLSPEVKQPGHEVDHSPPTNAEIKKMWIYTSTLPSIVLGCYII